MYFYAAKIGTPRRCVRAPGLRLRASRPRSRGTKKPAAAPRGRAAGFGLFPFYGERPMSGLGACIVQVGRQDDVRHLGRAESEGPEPIYVDMPALACGCLFSIAVHFYLHALCTSCARSLLERLPGTLGQVVCSYGFPVGVFLDEGIIHVVVAIPLVAGRSQVAPHDVIHTAFKGVI